MVEAILFDDGLAELAPLTDLRPSFAIRTGALTTRQRLVDILGLNLIGLFVPQRLEAMAKARINERHINYVLPGDGPILLVNGRCALAYFAISDLREGQWLIEQQTGHIVAARLSRAATAEFLKTFQCGPGERIEIQHTSMISRPWHFKAFRDRALATDLAMLSRRVPAVTPPGCTVIPGSHPGMAVHVHSRAKVYPGTIFDCEHGPILIDESAVIRPACTLIGPIYIGPHTTILDRAIIKGNTSIGPHCKIAGEVGGTIFHGYANKAHDGHLGDSWIGKWANLGAGTTNSNLLNTYGEIAMRALPGGSMERTGEQFLGCIIGDHVKTAICTRIMTGAVVHTGTMYAATAPISGTIPGFSWVTDAGTRRYAAPKFIEVMQTVMSRRKETARAAYIDRVKQLIEQSPVQAAIAPPQ